MVFGCPVICSRVSAIPEAGGDAAIYADLTAESFLAAIQLILSDDALRSEKAYLGYRQAARFTVGQCAREVLRIYQSQG